MKMKAKRVLLTGVGLLAAFVLWTILIMSVDVQNVGQQGTAVGFAAFNTWFHRLIGVHSYTPAVCRNHVFYNTDSERNFDDI